MRAYLRVAVLWVVRGLAVVPASGAGCWGWAAICEFPSGPGSGVREMRVHLRVPVPQVVWGLAVVSASGAGC